MNRSILILSISIGFLSIIGIPTKAADNNVVPDNNPFHNRKVIISEMAPFLEGIEKAEGFLYLGSYKLHNHLLPNKNIINSLEKARQNNSLNGNILIALENFLTVEEQKKGSQDVQSGDSLQAYEKLGIRLISTASYFTATHYKILVSANYAFVGTTNFDKDFIEGPLHIRDFSLIFTEPALIHELKEIFQADRDRLRSEMASFKVTDIGEGGTRLTWGPEQHRQHLQQLIQHAKTSIFIYQQALQDENLTSLLIDAIKRGVTVSILMSEFPFGEKHGNKSFENQKAITNTKSLNGNAKGEVRLTGQMLKEGDLQNKKLHIHAKVMIINGDDPKTAIMYLGSANFYAPALDKDRNVGVVTRNPDYINPVLVRFKKDWQMHKDFAVRGLAS